MVMSKYRFGLTTLLFWLILVFSVILVEGMNFSSKTFMTHLKLDELILVSIVVFGSILFYYIVEKRKNKATISWLALPFACAFLVCGLVGIWMSGPGSYTIGDISFNYDVPLVDRLTWTFGLIASALVFYLAIGVWSKRILRAKSLLAILWCFIAFCFIAIIYSLATEFQSYKLIFNFEALLVDKVAYKSIKSFFNNENNYGQLLMLGIFAMIIIDAIKHRWWYCIFIIGIYSAMVFSTSYTALATSFLIIVIYYTYRFFATIKLHAIRNVITLMIVLAIIGGLFAIYAILYHFEVPFVSNLTKYINESILNKDFHTFTGRTTIWGKALSLLSSPIDLIFGRGFKNFNYLYAAYNQVASSTSYLKLHIDSTYIEIIGEYGLLGLLSYITLLVLYFGMCIYCIFKKRDRIAFPSIFIMISFVIYSCFETLVIFEMGVAGAAAFIILVLPVLIEYQNAKNKPYLETNLMDEHFNIEITQYSSKMIVQTLSMFLSAIVLGIGLTFIFNRGYLLPAIFLFATFFLLWMVMPYLFAMWHKQASLKLLMLRCISLSCLLVVVPLMISLPLFITIEDNLIGYIVFGCVFVLTMFLEFSFTLLFKSSPKEFVKLVWYQAIRPFLVPLSATLVVALPLGIALNYFYDLKMLSASMFVIIFVGIYFLLVYFMPNIKNCKKHNKFLIKEMNNRFIRRQKMAIVLGKK